MGTVAIDASCLSIDGTRQWLVSGGIDPSRVPRGLWGDRLRAARDAGLNCVGVPVVWSLHEPTPGRFLFEGERDIAAFIREAHACGLYVSLRPGPFVGDGHDRGGIPTWLDESTGLVLRSSHPEFLKATSRWFASLLGQLKGLQAIEGGPIVLVECEHRWFCGDEAQSKSYLGELARYLREHGVRVPIVSTHNLYTSVEGTIDAWSGHESLFSTIRQLRAINPAQPVFLMDLEMGRPSIWNEKTGKPTRGEDVAQQLTQVLAAGGQYQLGPFYGGIHHGFSSGRLPFERDAYLQATAEAGAVLDVRGNRGELYQAVRRVSSFASGFANVLASLDREAQVVVQPGSADVSVVAQRGAIGHVTWVMAPGHSTSRRIIPLSLHDGGSVEVDLTGMSSAWVAQNVHLDEQTRLDLSTLSVVGFCGDVLVVVGPVGANGEVVINGSHCGVKVGRAATPNTYALENIRIVVCSPAQFASVMMRPEGVYLGASSMDSSGKPIASSADKVVLLAADGSEQKLEATRPMRAPASPKIVQWSAADCSSYVEGKSPRFARIAGPKALEDLGTPLGYGWYRIELKASSSRRVKSGWFGSGDRLHVWSQGSFAGVIGRGVGATPAYAALPVKKGKTTISVLADNFGRAAGGVYIGAKRGLWEHVWEVKALPAVKPTLETGEPMSPMVFRKPMTRLHSDDVTMPERPTWTINWRKKAPLAMTLDVCELGEVTGLVLLNDEPVHVFSDGGLDHVILDDKLRRGSNVVQLAVIGDAEGLLARARKAVRFDECVSNLTADASWSFAAWERPGEAEFVPMSKARCESLAGIPTWWRSTFSLSRVDRPLVLKLQGLSKGQLFVNGENICRYFVSTHDGEAVAGQAEYIVQEPWLRSDSENEIVLFDECGCSPAKISMRWG